MKKLIYPWALIFIMTTLAACSSARKAQLAAADDPRQAIDEVTQIMQQAQQQQVDVLAAKQFGKGVAYLEAARLGTGQGDLKETILDNAATAKAFFEDAAKTAATKAPAATRILAARKSALDAGVRNSKLLQEQLLNIDKDLKSESKQFTRSLSAKDFARLQKQYLLLETRAVQFSQLDGARQAIRQARQNDAKDLAGQTLHTAALDFETAINTIAQSPRSPGLYQESVATAIASATLLTDVMNVILDAKGTPEHIALQIVKQKRALGELNSNVGKLQANLQSTRRSLEEKEGALKKTESELKRTEGVLKSQEEQLERASTQVRFQQAMDQARRELSQDDALVYQQGNKLVFRLKRVNFDTGTAVIPEFSKLLISKVNGIIKKLDAEKVVVQGHTDSVGSTQVNKRLSMERAKAVANYLFSFRGGYKIQYAGYGESHPIAPNETPAGRATNRRVDLVVSVKQ